MEEYKKAEIIGFKIMHILTYDNEEEYKEKISKLSKDEIEEIDKIIDDAYKLCKQWIDAKALRL